MNALKIHFPTDIGLLSDCVKNINRAVKKIRKTNRESTHPFVVKQGQSRERFCQLEKCSGVEAMKPSKK